MVEPPESVEPDEGGGDAELEVAAAAGMISFISCSCWYDLF